MWRFVGSRHVPASLLSAKGWQAPRNRLHQPASQSWKSPLSWVELSGPPAARTPRTPVEMFYREPVFSEAFVVRCQYSEWEWQYSSSMAVRCSPSICPPIDRFASEVENALIISSRGVAYPLLFLQRVGPLFALSSSSSLVEAWGSRTQIFDQNALTIPPPVPANARCVSENRARKVL